ncbi:hypothetical protein HKX48_008858, partial [Thoreauomyces humboldtii]
MSPPQQQPSALQSTTRHQQQQQHQVPPRNQAQEQVQFQQWQKQQQQQQRQHQLEHEQTQGQTQRQFPPSQQPIPTPPFRQRSSSHLGYIDQLQHQQHQHDRPPKQTQSQPSQQPSSHHRRQQSTPTIPSIVTITTTTAPFRPGNRARDSYQDSTMESPTSSVASAPSDFLSEPRTSVHGTWDRDRQSSPMSRTSVASVGGPPMSGNGDEAVGQYERLMSRRRAGHGDVGDDGGGGMRPRSVSSPAVTQSTMAKVGPVPGSEVEAESPSGSGFRKGSVASINYYQMPSPRYVGEADYGEAHTSVYVESTSPMPSPAPARHQHQQRRESRSIETLKDRMQPSSPPLQSARTASTIDLTTPRIPQGFEEAFSPQFGSVVPPLFSGYLYKLGRNKRWQWRLLRFDGQLLTCLSNSKIKIPRGGGESSGGGSGGGNPSGGGATATSPTYIPIPNSQPMPLLTSSLLAHEHHLGEAARDGSRWVHLPKWTIHIGSVTSISLIKRTVKGRRFANVDMTAGSEAGTMASATTTASDGTGLQQRQQQPPDVSPPKWYGTGKVFVIRTNEAKNYVLRAKRTDDLERWLFVLVGMWRVVSKQATAGPERTMDVARSTTDLPGGATDLWQDTMGRVRRHVSFVAPPGAARQQPSPSSRMAGPTEKMTLGGDCTGNGDVMEQDTLGRPRRHISFVPPPGVAPGAHRKPPASSLATSYEDPTSSTGQAPVVPSRSESLQSQPESRQSERDDGGRFLRPPGPQSPPLEGLKERFSSWGTEPEAYTPTDDEAGPISAFDLHQHHQRQHQHQKSLADAQDTADAQAYLPDDELDSPAFSVNPIDMSVPASAVLPPSITTPTTPTQRVPAKDLRNNIVQQLDDLAKDMRIAQTTQKELRKLGIQTGLPTLPWYPARKESLETSLTSAEPGGDTPRRNSGLLSAGVSRGGGGTPISPALPGSPIPSPRRSSQLGDRGGGGRSPLPATQQVLFAGQQVPPKSPVQVPRTAPPAPNQANHNRSLSAPGSPVAQPRVRQSSDDTSSAQQIPRPRRESLASRPPTIVTFHPSPLAKNIVTIVSASGQVQPHIPTAPHSIVQPLLGTRTGLGTGHSSVGRKPSRKEAKAAQSTPTIMWTAPPPPSSSPSSSSPATASVTTSNTFRPSNLHDPNHHTRRQRNDIPPQQHHHHPRSATSITAAVYEAWRSSLASLIEHDRGVRVSVLGTASSETLLVDDMADRGSRIFTSTSTSSSIPPPTAGPPSRPLPTLPAEPGGTATGNDERERSLDRWIGARRRVVENTVVVE